MIFAVYFSSTLFRSQIFSLMKCRSCTLAGMSLVRNAVTMLPAVVFEQPSKQKENKQHHCTKVPNSIDSLHHHACLLLLLLLFVVCCCRHHSTTTLVNFPFGLMVVFEQPSKQKENNQHHCTKVPHSIVDTLLIVCCLLMPSSLHHHTCQFSFWFDGCL